MPNEKSAVKNEHHPAKKTLKKSEEWHRTILRAAMDGFWLTDLEGRLLEVNEAYCRMSGYSEPELLTMSIADLSVLESREQVAMHINGIMDRGQDRFETRHRHKNGSIIDVEVSAQYQTFASGRIIVFLRDITEQLRAEDALKESDSFIRSVMDNLPLGIAVNSVDPAVSFLYMNDNFPGFYRTTREALTSPDAFWGAVYEDPDFRTEISKRVMDDCTSGDPEKMHWADVPITRTGEGTTYVEAKNTLIPDKQLMVSTVWDVTGRKQAELALLQEQELYADLVNTLPAGAYRLRVKNLGNWQAERWRTMAKTLYSFDFASDRFCAILGITRESIAADPALISDLIHPDDRDDFNARNAQAMTDLDTFVWEGRINNSKHTRWVHFESLPRMIAPETVLWTGIVVDITERKKLQEQLSHAHKMESVGRLAGGVAHDFNNMLSVIIGHAELARKRESAPLQLREHLEQIQKAAEHSADIVRQLLAFARKQTISPKVFDLNDTVASMIKMLRRLIGEEIELVWRPEMALCPVKMDPAQINQILANLCVNARDAISGVGRISIETGNKTIGADFCTGHTGFSPGEYVLLTVSDNGSGMEKETLSKIFEPFFTTKEVGKGTGLGLAMVYGIVKQNDGFIYVSSEPGQGTGFNIYLPRYLGKKEKESLEKPVQPAELGKETILLVEDEPALLDLGIQLLEMQGYRVLAASTPGEAIRLAEKHSGEIHLLLSDVVMPEMNGRELSKKLLSLYPGLKRLFMSGYTADIIAHHGVLDEEVQFIQKPFSLETLAAKVREALDHLS